MMHLQIIRYLQPEKVQNRFCPNDLQPTTFREHHLSRELSDLETLGITETIADLPYVFLDVSLNDTIFFF